MNDRSESLPSFSDPPVVEVLLGVQFERLQGFQSIHTGPLWDTFRADFPLVQEHPQLAPTYETFGTKPIGAGTTLQFSLQSPSITPRLWFLNEEHTELVQFQPDRFIHNWRKIQIGDSYPRYEAIRARYDEELNALQRFLSDHQLGELRPNQCEVTYVNHIVSDEISDIGAKPHSVFRFIRNEFASLVFDGIENTSFEVRFVLSTEGDRPIGRLYATAQPGLSREGKPMIALTMSAKGAPTEASLEAALRFVDFGRDKIVRGFTDLTTDAMHEHWGRTQ